MLSVFWQEGFAYGTQLLKGTKGTQTSKTILPVESEWLVLEENQNIVALHVVSSLVFIISC